MKKVVILEPFLNCKASNSIIKSKEPNISTFRAITLFKKRFKVEFIDLKIDEIKQTALYNKLKDADFIFINVKSYNKLFSQKIINYSLNNMRSKVFVFGQIPSYDPFLIQGDGSANTKNYKRDDYRFVSSIKGEFYNFARYFIDDPKKYCKMDIIDLKTHKDFNDMDNIPMLDLKELKSRKYYTVYPLKGVKRNKWAFMNLTQGCPYNCIFCSQTLRISQGKQISHFSSDEAIKRIKRMLSNGFNAIRFNDDNFLSNKLFIRELCLKITKQNLKFRWMAQVRADSLDDKTLALMKKAGCESLNFGVESASERILRILEKGETLSSIDKAIKLCKKYKILTVNYYMIGAPSETLSEIKKSIDFSFRTKPDVLQIAYFTAYEGSSFFEKNKKIFLSNKEQVSYHYSNNKFNFSNIKKNKLKKIYRNWYLAYYLIHPFKSLRVIFNLLALRFFY